MQGPRPQRQLAVVRSCYVPVASLLLLLLLLLLLQPVVLAVSWLRFTSGA
jgi:hypothetical protein